jgi:hypothetical protein
VFVNRIGPLTATALAALMSPLMVAAPAGADPGGNTVGSSLCQVEEGQQICQSVTGVYSLTETPSDLLILNLHLIQEETITTETATISQTLELDEQYLYRSGDANVVILRRLQTRTIDGQTTSCTDFGRLVFAGGEVRLEPVVTDCTG